MLNSHARTRRSVCLPSRPAVNRLAGAAVWLLLPMAASAAEPGLLWEIGKPDNDDRELALAPGGYEKLREDGFFVVGKSDPARDWPYVHPGPIDHWAGSRQHTFTIVFGLKAAPTAGQCTLNCDLLDTHSRTPPELRITVNGQNFSQRVPAGAGDASVFGRADQGKEHKFELAFPATLLRAGTNEIALTTLSGSWVLYDWIGLASPPGLELAEVKGTVLGAVSSPPMLVEREGQLRQTVRLAIRHFGDETPAKVHVDGAEPVSLTLRTASQSFEVAVAAVEKETPVTVRVEVPGQAPATQAITLKPVRKWVVYLLPHSHVDIGYTHVQTDVERAQWKYLEMAIETAQKSADNPPGSRFKWNVEVLWAVDSYLKQATPEKRQEFIDAVKAGQVGLQALYGNELTGLCRPEELLRLMSCAQRVSQICGTPITSAMITDVPGYTWGTVPAMAHCGVKYFSIGPNGGDRIGHTIAAWGDKPFWWLGPNGKDKVLVWMTGTGYYQVFQSPQRLLDYLTRLGDGGYPYDCVQVRHCLGDNGAPDVNFPAKVKEWNAQYAYPKLVIATTDEMFRDLEQRYGDKLPTAQGDFTPYWEDGAASSAQETILNRAAADRLIQAETLFALFRPQAYPAADFEQAWRNVILYDEHTWGAHNSISQPDHPFVKSQWAIKQAFALDGDKQSRHLLDAALTARGEPVLAPPNVNVIDVLNTTSLGIPWGLVTVPKEWSSAGDAVRMSPDQKTPRLAQRLTTGELVFRPCWGPLRCQRFYIAAGTPPAPKEPGAQAEGVMLTSARSALGVALQLRLNEQTGAIASLTYDGHEYVDPQAPTALNDYWYLPGSDLKGLQRNGPVKIAVKERGPLIASLVVESEAPGCRKLTREYRVHALRNYVEIINTVDKLPVRAKEGVHFGFGFNVPDGVVRMDVAWAVVRPETDQIPGACKNWFTVQRWVDVSNKDRGITWLTPDAPLVEVGGVTANLIGSLPDPRAWRDHLEPSQTIYSWAMNNHWHTNYKADQEGPTVFRYLLWPHGSQEPQRAARVALECSQPLVVAPARGELPTQSLLRISGDAVLTALKPSEDGRARIVRLFADSDQPTQATLEWSDPQPKAVWLSDATEQPREPVRGPIPIPAWGLVTVRADLP
jgi:alpha-mannosidase